MRLTLRGVSPLVMQPLNIDVIDVSTPSGRSAILLGMLSYFFLFALLTGGMNLAIDSTAGERERGSLEPLLCLPVTRDQLIVGKIFAACLFMAVSLSLSLVSFSRHAQVRALGRTRHDSQLRSAGRVRRILAAGAVRTARRRVNDLGCVVYEKLQRSANLA